MGKKIGIDLGTTNSVVAIVEGPRAKVLQSRENRDVTRSVVGIRRRKARDNDAKSEILVGDVAVDNWPLAIEDTIISIKRLMGRGANDRELARVKEWAQYKIVEPSHGTSDSVRVLMGGQEYSPVDISAMILGKIKEDAEFRLGAEVTHAVITVPAYFSQAQCQATRLAGQQAGLIVTKILAEPSAAAIAFGLDSGEESEPKNVLVYDFGGGTFDVSVLLMAGNVAATLNKEGDMWLGGDNLDQIIVEWALDEIRREYHADPTSDRRFMVALHLAAQRAKERLSSAHSDEIILASMLKDDAGNLVDIDLEITRSEFEHMLLPLVGVYKTCSCGRNNYQQDPTCDRCGTSLASAPTRDGRTVEIVRRAIENAQLKPEDIDYVLMAGNSTTVPLVQRSMEDFFGKEKILRNVQAKQCVAMGAAIVAALLGERWVCQAPDAEDATRQCNRENAAEALVCERCGSPKVSRGETEVASPPQSEDLLIPDLKWGDVAPFYYGAEAADDTFVPFVMKGDPFPTAKATSHLFHTRQANQRMISIPVMSRDDLENPRINQREGEAFAVLPLGLPKDTEIRVSIWLNADQIFEIAASLGRIDLKPWVMKGDADAGAVKAIEELERKIAEKRDGADPSELGKVDGLYNQAIDLLKQDKFEEALELAESGVEQAAQLADDVAGSRGENLINYADFVIGQYSWLLDAEQTYRLNELKNGARTAIRERSPLVEQKLDDLEFELNRLPESIGVLLGISGYIISQIQPFEPATSAALLQELRQIESAFKAADQRAQAMLDALAQKVVAEQQRIELGRGRKPTCPTCHVEVEKGARYCANNHDQWRVGFGRSPTTTH